ncbi:MAG: hypothetical protein KAJ07_00345 [Planctomycetes bacterium]|nr:hypothetical protein [Planctomycetota bacterium]
MSLFTEEEAKKKWCCQALELEECNKGVTNVAGFCSASVCMAWRWDIESKSHLEVVPDKKDPDDMVTVDYPQSEWKGYCGLAGRPE